MLSKCINNPSNEILTFSVYFLKTVNYFLKQIAQLCTREDLRWHPCRTCLSRRLTEKLPPLQFSPSACDRSWHLPHLSVFSDVTARASVTDRCGRLQVRSQPLGETWRGECLSASPREEDKEMLYDCSVTVLTHRRAAGPKLRRIGRSLKEVVMDSGNTSHPDWVSNHSASTQKLSSSGRPAESTSGGRLLLHLMPYKVLIHYTGCSITLPPSPLDFDFRVWS